MSLFGWLRPRPKFAIYVDCDKNGEHSWRLIAADDPDAAKGKPTGIAISPRRGREGTYQRVSDCLLSALGALKGIGIDASRAGYWYETAPGGGSASRGLGPIAEAVGPGKPGVEGGI